jgi:hypothetical protein
MSATMQVCPVEGCPWENDIIERDEPSVVAATNATLRHLMSAHPNLVPEAWKEMFVKRVHLEVVK